MVTSFSFSEGSGSNNFMIPISKASDETFDHLVLTSERLCLKWKTEHRTSDVIDHGALVFPDFSLFLTAAKSISESSTKVWANYWKHFRNSNDRKCQMSMSMIAKRN